MLSFEGKVALVVGGTSGIGRAVAEGYARLGAAVVVAGRHEAQGAETVRRIEAAGGRAAFVAADVREEADVAALTEAVLSRHGRLHCAYDGAGIERYGALTDLDADGLREVVATNLTGAALCVKHQLPAIADSGGGAIVLMSSQGGTGVGVPTNGAYTATKAGIVGLTMTAALEGGPRGVRVNCIRAANIASEMARAAWTSFGVSEERIREHSPVGRLGTPEDVAAAALFLTSDAASFVNGAALAVDGGWSLQPAL